MLKPSATTILLVDDEPDILEMYSYELQRIGFQVFVASNGQDALRIAKEKMPDLMLLDVKMPGMSGADVIMKMKASSTLAPIKVAFLTAYGDKNVEGLSEKFAREAGAVDLIRKGISLQDFAERVKKCLE